MSTNSIITLNQTGYTLYPTNFTIGSGANAVIYNYVSGTSYNYISQNTQTNITGSYVAYSSYIIGITIADSVTNVGNSTFKNLANLNSLNLGNGLKTIQTQGFQFCAIYIYI